MNVGVSIKNIGNYLKSSITRTSNAETNLKSFNSLNIKTKSSTTTTASNGNNSGSSAAGNTTNGMSTSNSNGVLTESTKVKNSANLQHRHSNPTGGTVHLTSTNVSSAKSRVLQANSNSISDNNNPANALPRIRINS